MEGALRRYIRCSRIDNDESQIVQPAWLVRRHPRSLHVHFLPAKATASAGSDITWCYQGLELSPPLLPLSPFLLRGGPSFAVFAASRKWRSKHHPATRTRTRTRTRSLRLPRTGRRRRNCHVYGRSSIFANFSREGASLGYASVVC
jgi:hypothetical protein